jgi:hypothetical protein
MSCSIRAQSLVQPTLADKREKTANYLMNTRNGLRSGGSRPSGGVAAADRISSIAMPLYELSLAPAGAAAFKNASIRIIDVKIR